MVTSTIADAPAAATRVTVSPIPRSGKSAAWRACGVTTSAMRPRTWPKSVPASSGTSASGASMPAGGVTATGACGTTRARAVPLESSVVRATKNGASNTDRSTS